MSDPYIVDVDATQNAPYTQIVVSLAAGATLEVPGKLRYLALLTATDRNEVEISFSGSRFEDFPAGFLVSGFVSKSFWVKNTSGSANDITFVKGEGRLEDSRVLLSSLTAVPISAALNSFADGHDVAFGAKADAVSATDIATATYMALFKRFLATHMTTGLGLAADAAAASDSAAGSVIAHLKRLSAKSDNLINSIFTLNSAATTNKTEIKASAGRIKSISVFNATAATKFVRLYDSLAAGVTVGTTVPFQTYAIPTLDHRHIDFPGGATFVTGITIATTLNAIVTDATAIAAGDLQMKIEYQ